MSNLSNSSSKVRIVAKIRGSTDHDAESLKASSTPWISVRKHNEGEPNEKVTISFVDQSASRKNTYDMDYCYQQNEDLGLIYSREVKPLLSGVLNGRNASIIAYGARGSGKTYTIQGSEEAPGLASLSISEILSLLEESGKLIRVSMYEVSQDRIIDILDSDHREVQVCENGKGKIELRGLSQVSISSTLEFQKLYYTSGTRKAPEKVGNKVPVRSHKGLMIHIFSNHENSSNKLAGKLNFVDLAGYEDARRKSISCGNLGENASINKSLYALLNVLYALSANESRVPYRESKLSRVLQDSIGGNSRVLLLNCLNSSFCQDAMYTVSLASRSFQGNNRVSDCMVKSIKSSAKPVHSSIKNRSATVSGTTKKEKSLRVQFHKTNDTGRKLFGDGIPSTTPKEAKFSVDCSPAMPFSATVNNKSHIEGETIADLSLGVIESTSTTEKETSQAHVDIAPEVSLVDKIYNKPEASLIDGGETIADLSLGVIESTSTMEKETSQAHVDIAPEISLVDKICNNPEASLVDEVLSPLVSDADIKMSTFLENYGGGMTEKENKNVQINEEKSPPLSARLRNLSNNLKSLCSSTPPTIMISQDLSTPFSRLSCTNVAEPQTPVTGITGKTNDNWELARFQSPREIFGNCTSGIKQTLVTDCLRFLNSANKDELKGLKGIGEKRATYILQLREESPEPFKSLDDLQDIGLSAKQAKGLMKRVAGELFN